MPRPNVHQDVDTSGNIVPWSPSVSTPTPTYGGSYGRDEQAFQGESSVSHPVYDSGRGNGNDGTGVNNINDVINETITADTVTTSTKPDSIYNVYGEEVDLTNISDDIWNLAKQAADPTTNPGYALSAEGQKLKGMGIMPGSNEWVAHFGLPQIVTTSGRTGKPVTTGISRGDTTTGYMDEYGQIIEGGSPIMSGQGKYLMDQYDDSKTYEENIDDYYEMREAEQAQQTGGDQGYGYGYGSSGGGGYSMAGVHPRSFYKGLQYQDFSGKEVHKMLASNQKVEAANILSGLSQGAQAFAMDPKTRGILTVLQA